VLRLSKARSHRSQVTRTPGRNERDRLPVEDHLAHGQMVPGFEHSLTIQATVISRQSGKVIVDAGNKSVADPADVTMVGHDRKVFRFDEEHGIFDAAGGS
jgi:D-serine deaminase-like pyridoxal phosphate-dependent protein